MANIVKSAIVRGYLHLCIRRIGSILPCCLPFGKAGELQILCCQGIKVNDYNFTLDAWTLKPSGFCNVGVKSTQNFFCTRFGVCHVFFVGVPGHLFDHTRPLLVR